MHTHILKFEVSKSKRKYYENAPQLGEVIRNTKQIQIKQHNIGSSKSPQRTLIARTKRLLQYNVSPQKLNQTVTTRLTASLDVKRGSATRMKSKRDSRINQTKRQLQLLNQLYRDNNKDQIKRYQQQIQQEQSQIHSVVAQYRLRKKCNPNKTLKGRSFRQSIPKTAYSPSQNQEEDLNFETKANQKKSEFEQMQMDISFDRMHPYRRLLITRLKNNRANVQPWTISPNS